MAEPTPPTLPSELPVLPLRRTVAFPLTLQPLAVNRPVSIETVNRALGADRLILLLLQENDADDPTPEDVRRIGTVAVVRQMAKTSGGINIIIEGIARVRADVVTRVGTSMRAQITPLPEPYERTIEVEAHVRRIQELIEKALSLATGLSEELRAVVMNIDDPLRLAYVLATLLDMKPAEKQAVLEENDLVKKLEAIANSLTREIELLELKGKIESQAQQEMTDAQRQVLPAPAAEGDPAGAGRRRRQRDRRAAKAGRRREASGNGRRRRAARSRSAGTHGTGIARVPDAADLYRLDSRRALDRDDRGPARSGRSPACPRRGPLRSRQGQGTDRRVPGRPQVEGRHEGPDSLFRRPSRRRQDVARPVDRPRHVAKVRAAFRWAACATKPRSAAIAAPTSARFPDASSRR